MGVVFFETVGVNYTPEGLRDGLLAGLWVPGIALSVAAIGSLLLPGVEAVRRHKEEAEQAAEREYAETVGQAV